MISVNQVMAEEIKEDLYRPIRRTRKPRGVRKLDGTGPTPGQGLGKDNCPTTKSNKK